MAKSGSGVFDGFSDSSTLQTYQVPWYQRVAVAGGATFFVSIAGVLVLAGTLAKRTSKYLVGPLSFIGTNVKHTSKYLTGPLVFSGTLTKLPKKSFGGVLTFSAIMRKSTKKLMGGTLSFVGICTAILTSLKLVFLQGSISFEGTTLKKVSKGFAGVLEFFGVKRRQHIVPPKPTAQWLIEVQMGAERTQGQHSKAQASQAMQDDKSWRFHRYSKGFKP